MKMRELDQSIFETIFHSEYGNYKIIKDLGIINNRRFVQIKFLATGYEKSIRYEKAIDSKAIRDPYYPITYNIGYCGNVYNVRKYKRAYDRWHGILSRCYNINDKDYKTYGAIGITVDPRWHSFENFLKDLPTLPIIGIPNPSFDLLDYQIDKDYMQMNIPKEQRVYSKDTCVLINARDNANLKLIDNSKFKVNNYYGVYKAGRFYYPTIMHNGIKYNLGVYDNEIAAANAYNYYYKLLNSKNDCTIDTINDVPYMGIKEFSKYNKRETLIPAFRIK